MLLGATCEARMMATIRLTARTRTLAGALKGLLFICEHQMQTIVTEATSQVEQLVSLDELVFGSVQRNQRGGSGYEGSRKIDMPLPCGRVDTYLDVCSYPCAVGCIVLYRCGYLAVIRIRYMRSRTRSSPWCPPFQQASPFAPMVHGTSLLLSAPSQDPDTKHIRVLLPACPAPKAMLLLTRAVALRNFPGPDH
jgi:hypothetical protein